MPRAIAFTLLLLPVVSFADEPPRPNVLFIAIDDLNDWVGCLGGHPQASTPHIDALAKRGMLFANAHCNAPLCNPSRASVLTGLLPSTSGVHGNEQDWRKSPYLNDHPALPRWLQQHGYRTAACGKIFHANHGGECAALQGGHGGLQGFDDFEAWDERFPAKDRQLLADAVLPGQNFNGLDIWHWDWGPIDASDDETADGRAVAWAETQLEATHEVPFFVAVGLYRPHSPMYVPQKYFDAFPLDGITLPLFPNDDLDDVPAIAKAFRGRPSDHHPEIVAKGLWDDAVRGYLANVAFADAMVGRLMAALDASPYAKNTIVVLWSDHGWHLGEKGKWHKSTLWEEATRVPLIVVAPGVTQVGSTCDRAVSLVDLYPTLCELCHLPLPERRDGMSLVPLLRNADATGHPPAVTVLSGQHAAVRSDRWRLIRYGDGSQELYDHDHDPHEWTNLADDHRFAGVKADLACHLPTEIRTFEEDRNFPNEPGFRPIFNGYDLTGWEDSDGSWQADDGMIIGMSRTAETPNRPLVWTGSRPVEFELRFRYRSPDRASLHIHCDGSDGISLPTKSSDWIDVTVTHQTGRTTCVLAGKVIHTSSEIFPANEACRISFTQKHGHIDLADIRLRDIARP